MEFMFPEVVEDQATIPEQFRPLYVNKEDKFVLDKEDKKVRSAVEALVGFNKTLKTVRGELDTARKTKVDLSPLKQFGETPEVIAQTVQEQLKGYQDQIAKGGQAKLDLEALRKDMNAAHEKDKTTWETRNKGLQSQLFELLVENNARAAVAELKGEADLLMPFIRDRVKVQEEDGKVNVYVVDEKGNIRHGAGGNPMTIPEIVKEMKGLPKYARLFESEAPKGGGAPPRAKGKTPTGDESELTPTQKIALGLSRGQYKSGARAGAQ